MSDEIDRSLIGSIVEEGRQLARLFRSCSFNYVPRNGNNAAHLLARRRKFAISDEWWMEEAPPFLLQALAADGLAP